MGGGVISKMPPSMPILLPKSGIRGLNKSPIAEMINSILALRKNCFKSNISVDELKMIARYLSSHEHWSFDLGPLNFKRAK